MLLGGHRTNPRARPKTKYPFWGVAYGLNNLNTTRYMRLSLKENAMSPKNSTPEHTSQADSAPEAPAAEPTVVKDRRFWGRQSKGQEQEGEAQEGQSEAATSAEGGHDERLAEIEALKIKLAANQAKLNATVVQYKDALDEFEGAKARLRRDVAKDVEVGKRNILVGLLEVIDNLERALGAATGKASSSDKDFGGFFDGVTMVRDQFVAKLSALGVTRVAILGEPFDPTHFEAISTVPVAEQGQHDTVVGVVRDAYLLGNETLRHGIVAVGKFSGDAAN